MSNRIVSDMQSTLSVFVEDTDVPESEFTDVSAADLQPIAENTVGVLSAKSGWSYELIGYKFVAHNKVRFDFRGRLGYHVQV